MLGFWVMADDGHHAGLQIPGRAVAPAAAPPPPEESELRPVETDFGPMITR